MARPKRGDVLSLTIDDLEWLGRLTAVELRPILGATEIYGYRNRMEFTVAPPRASKPSPPLPSGERVGVRGDLIVGLHEADRYDAVLDVERCLLQSDRMNALLDE